MTYFVTLAEAAEPELKAANLGAWLDRLELEHDNLRAALGRATENCHLDAAFNLVTSLYQFWLRSGHFGTARHWLNTVLTLEGGTQGDPRLHNKRTRTLLEAASFDTYVSDWDLAAARLQEAHQQARQSGDQGLEAEALHEFADLTRRRGDFAHAVLLQTQSLAMARASRDAWLVGLVLMGQGLSFFVAGDLVGARAALHEARFLPAISDPWLKASILNILGEMARQEGDYVGAGHYYEDALALVEVSALREARAVTSVNLAFVLNRRGEYNRAVSLLQASIAVISSLGDNRNLGMTLTAFAGAMIGQGRLARGVCLLAAVEAGLREKGIDLEATDQKEYDDYLAAARARLTDAAFAQAWAEGQAMTLEEAVQYALETEDLTGF